MRTQLDAIPCQDDPFSYGGNVFPLTVCIKPNADRAVKSSYSALTALLPRCCGAVIALLYASKESFNSLLLAR